MNLAGPAPATAHARHADQPPAARVRPDSESGSSAATTSETVIVVLADIAPASRLWGYTRFLFGRFTLPRVPGLNFARVLGSGQDGGFGLKPSLSRQGMLCAFVDDDAANSFIESSYVEDFRRHSRECLTARLKAYSCRGSWGGRKLALSTGVPADGPVAALTRASIRPARAAEFWRKAPPAETSLGSAKGCMLAVGLGEAPLLRQATFSVWDSVASMDAYAHTGAHLEAIRASHAGGYFSESMFVRFMPVDLRGAWKGRVYG